MPLTVVWYYYYDSFVIIVILTGPMVQGNPQLVTLNTGKATSFATVVVPPHDAGRSAESKGRRCPPFTSLLHCVGLLLPMRQPLLPGTIDPAMHIMAAMHMHMP